ncbi:transposable element Tcb1 transposase [Trichonephila clavipes]|nr:transposable element Tcb1 transposase [Trichonephila clavipes]
MAEYLKESPTSAKKANRQARLALAKMYVNQSTEYWENVIFIDESKCNFFGSDGKRKVWRKSNTAMHVKNVRPTIKYGGGDQIVWGCMASSGVGTFYSCLHSANKKKKLLSAAISIGEKIMNDAAKGIRQLKKSIHGTVNCGISVDGTWQRRGFSSLNGCVSAIYVDTGKIIDFETLSQFCRKCNSKTEQQNVKLQCNHHKGSSSSMEPVGAYSIF